MARRRRVLVALALALGVIAACSDDAHNDARGTVGASASTAAASTSADAAPVLRSIEDLAGRFDEAAGQRRLVLLMSPT